KALTGRLLQVFEDALITRVVGDHQHELIRGLQNRAPLLDRKYSSVVGERMNQNYCVFSSFNNFVEIANRSVLDGGGKRSIVPDCLVAFEKKSTDEIGRRQVFVTGNGDQRSIQSPGHVFNKSSLATAGRPLEHHRELPTIRRLK